MSDDLQRCAALLDAVPDPAMLVTDTRRIVLANPAASELFGAPLAGQSVLSFIRQPEPLAALERGFAMLAGAPGIAGVPIAARMIQSTPARETLLRVNVAPVGPGLGLSALLVCLRDISQVEEAEQQRRDFVANVSHELRSPLTVLSGFIETLKGPARDDQEATEQFLDIMEREAQRMARLVSDLLSLSRVESEERVRPRARVSMSEVLRATMAALRPQIDESGLEVAFSDMAEGAEVTGDRDQLVQVFHNLVENALKYGASGGRIEIVLQRVERAAGNGGSAASDLGASKSGAGSSATGGSGLRAPALRVSIRDHGDGIDAIHLPRLTERFYRVDGHRSRAMGGTGLGLAIVKHIVNRHRGRFTIQSTRGEGSTFSVTLPLA